jgi:hypothetical protein
MLAIGGPVHDAVRVLKLDASIRDLPLALASRSKRARRSGFELR